MCVRARACVTQRVLHRVYFSVSKATIITANILVVCVTSKRERKNTAASNTASVVARLPLYPLGMTQCWKIFYCKPVLVLRKQVFWVPRIWIIACRGFEGMFHLHGCDSLSWRRRYTLNNNVVETSNECSHIVKNIFLCYYFIFLLHCVLLMHDRFSMKEWQDKSFSSIRASKSVNV